MVYIIIETIAFIVFCITFIFYKKKKNKKIIDKTEIENKFDETQSFITHLDEKFEVKQPSNKQYMLLKLMCSTTSDINLILGKMQITFDEFQDIVRESVNQGLLQYIEEDEVEITELGLNYIELKEK